MIKYITLTIICVILSVGYIQAQDIPAPVKVETPSSISLKTEDQLKIQVQLLLAENASLKKQIADSHKEDVDKASSTLVQDLYKLYGVDPSKYDLHIDTMTFTLKPDK